MKILLINAPIWHKTGFRSSYNPGMGLLYIGAVLRENGHEVSIIDCEAFGYDYETIYEKARGFTHVGISSLSNGLDSAIEIASGLRKKYPEMWIAMGGAGPSCEPVTALGYCDAVCVGEGELVAEKVFSERGIHHGKPVEDLDSLPMPAYDLLQPVVGSSYWIGNLPRPEIGGRIVETTVMWSRGCPHACTFCSKATIERGYPRLRKPKNIVKELKFLKQKYGVNSIFVYDDELIGMGIEHNKWLTRVCNEISDANLGIAFKGQGRCSERFVDGFVAGHIKTAGFFAMMMGCESGSEKVKKRIRKGTTNEDIKHTLKVLHDGGIKVYGFWMVGMPEETSDDARETEKLIMEMAPYMDWIQVTVFSPLPGSTFWVEATEKEWLTDFDRAANFQTTGLLKMPWMSSSTIEKWRNRLVMAYDSKRGMIN